jgi:RNA polymerase sigma-70 factor (ECF subfamily)
MAGFSQILGNISTGRPDNLTGTEQGAAAAPALQNEPNPKQQPENVVEEVANSDQCPDLKCFLWAQLVTRLQDGDPEAMEELYTMFASGVRYYLARQLGSQDLEDRLHDAFVIVVDTIRSGELRDPRRLMGYIRTVVKRMVATSIDRQIQERRGRVDEDKTTLVSGRASPENATLHRQQVALVHEVLKELSDRDRLVLTRFYVDEVPAQTICDEMNLTMTQFRLLKSRAKNRFGELGRKRLKGAFLRKFW